eukprot:UC1_evm4s1831
MAGRSEGMRQRRGGPRNAGIGNQSHAVSSGPSSSLSTAGGGGDSGSEDEGVGYVAGAPTSAVASQDRQLELLYTVVGEGISRFFQRLKSVFARLTGSGGFASSSQQPRVRTTDPHALGALDKIEATQKTPYCAELPEHEEMLRELWRLLMPEALSFERKTKLWGRLGFQGTDPVTDLRGQGILGLRNMLYMARAYPDDVRGVLAREDHSFPFSLAVINVSAFLSLEVAEDARLADALFTGVESGEQALALYDELLALVFREFERNHRESIAEFVRRGGNPALAVMEYNGIWKRYLERLRTNMPSFVRLAQRARSNARAAEQHAKPTKAKVPEGNLIDL